MKCNASAREGRGAANDPCANIDSAVPPRPMRAKHLLIVLAVLLAGCGYKGPLTLPKQKPEAQKPAPAPASQPEEKKPDAS